MRSINVRLEVGTAHQYNVEDTIQINGHALIIYPVRFCQIALVGGDAHLKNERLMLRLEDT